jgi:large conductance mechanosensitive channel
VAQAKAAGAATLNYGMFMNTVINFLIVGFAIFMLVRQVNRLRPKPAPAPAGPALKQCKFCFSSIREEATRCPHCTSDLKAA